MLTARRFSRSTSATLWHQQVEGARVKIRVIVGSAIALLALALASSALAGRPLRVGVVEDAAKWGDSGAKMELARLAGFDSVRLTAQWSSGLTSPSSGELANLQNAAAAAAARGIGPIVSIYNVGSSSTPADEASRAQFVAYATAVVRALPSVTSFIVGNEPNSNFYWLPQFDAAGGDAAAQAYEALLAAAYDAIKAARPEATVVGGALEPRGGDNPAGAKPSHSPTTFIRDLGAAYRASGRTAPLMDVFDLHVYADNSSLPPSMAHPNGTTIAEADYGKLLSLLGEAFDGTAQAGSTLPILYGEFGVESLIPAAKSSLYTGTEPTTTRPVDEATQARYYTEAFKLAMCQPNVIGILAFHVSDESALTGWQSGPYYADDTAKPSLQAIRDAANAARAGTLTTCPDTTPPSGDTRRDQVRAPVHLHLDAEPERRGEPGGARLRRRGQCRQRLDDRDRPSGPAGDDRHSGAAVLDDRDRRKLRVHLVGGDVDLQVLARWVGVRPVHLARRLFGTGRRRPHLPGGGVRCGGGRRSESGCVQLDDRRHRHHLAGDDRHGRPGVPDDRHGRELLVHLVGSELDLQVLPRRGGLHDL